MNIASLSAVLLANALLPVAQGTNPVAAGRDSVHQRSDPSGPTALAAPAAQSDSTRTLRELRKRQERFERLRRRHFPTTYSSSGPCDERIGRFCFTFSDDDDWTPPDESEEVVAARLSLIAGLDSAARALPGDAWLVGQLVRYLVETDQAEAALDAAVSCGPVTDWWCRALAGFTLHTRGDYAAAQEAFGDALSAMPDEQRCDWTDLSEMLVGDLRKSYRRLSCEERAHVQSRILWLADPFYSRPGNELWTEHLSRHVLIQLQDRAASPEGIRWGNDLSRILVRYGWPTGWEQIQPRATDLGPPRVSSHYGRGARYFFPEDDEYVVDPFSIEMDDWDLDPPRPRAGHAPSYAVESFEPVDHRFAQFRRGDSTVVVVTYEMRDDSVPADANVRAVVVATRSDGQHMIAAEAETLEKRGTVVLTAPARPHILSVEVLAENEKRAGWARRGLDLSRLHAPGVRMSDILIVDATDSLPSDLEEAASHGRSPHPFHPGDRVGLYWEIYGLDPGAPRTIAATATLRKLGKNIFRRIAELTPLASNRPPVRMTWRDILPGNTGTFQRALAIQLPPRLGPGRYTLELDVELPNGATQTEQVEIEVAR